MSDSNIRTPNLPQMRDEVLPVLRLLNLLSERNEGEFTTSMYQVNEMPMMINRLSAIYKGKVNDLEQLKYFMENGIVEVTVRTSHAAMTLPIPGQKVSDNIGWNLTEVLQEQIDAVIERMKWAQRTYADELASNHDQEDIALRLLYEHALMSPVQVYQVPEVRSALQVLTERSLDVLAENAANSEERMRQATVRSQQRQAAQPPPQRQQPPRQRGNAPKIKKGKRGRRR